MKKPNFIELIASAITKTMPPQAASALTADQSAAIYKSSRTSGAPVPVLIDAPSVPNIAISTALKSPPPPPKLRGDEYFQRAGEGILDLPKSERAMLAEKQRDYDRAWHDATVRFTESAAQAFYKTTSHKQWADFMSSNEPLESVHVTTPESVLAEFREKKELAERTLEKISIETGEMIAPIRRNCIAKLENHLETMERSERQEFEHFGEAWKVGPRARAVRALIARLRSSEKNKTTGSPTQLLPFLRLD